MLIKTVFGIVSIVTKNFRTIQKKEDKNEKDRVK